ncbi:MAG: hypothetical protein AUJ20_08470 [Comamonadaceae bacterium CG1_02_60_18]|nr:MAG: hypothetical protein AUJ20_08470 [Comamonadaceae bacterium CG1_02_60_18]PIQ53635.1 MAG: hypothetical protein COW02_06315 [Comamonadaceae bacterium CG12_big_fil_rev_8_21_14_0_65_59_15]
MQTCTLHLCLVSDQATPNLLPLLDPAWHPATVVLATSERMKHNALALKSVMQTKGQGLKIELLDLPDAFDYGALADAFLNFLAAHEGQRVALNATGGTKLMALAAQEVFRSQGLPVYYVNVENDTVVVLGERTPAPPLRAQLKVHELLRAHGHTVDVPEQPQVTAALRDLTARFIDQIEHAGRALGVLNYLALQAQDAGGLSAKLSPEQLGSEALGELIGQLSDAGLVRQAGLQLSFKNELARFFAAGGWLEWHVLEQVQSLRGQMPQALTDVVCGLSVRFANPPKGRAGLDKNEIDVAFLYRNTLHIIECKTANLAASDATGTRASAAIYKLESLRRLGGLRTRAALIDYRGALAPGSVDRARAEEDGLLVISGRELRDLAGVLQRRWLQGGA